MLSNGFDKPLYLRRKPSLQLAVFLFVVHVLALLALTHALAVPLHLHIILWLVWAASAIYYAAYYWPRSYDKGPYWVWQANGAWVFDSEPVHTVMSLRHSVITAWFVLVKLYDSHGTRHCLYFADQLEADTWRRVRVRRGCAQAKETCSPGERQ